MYMNFTDWNYLINGTQRQQSVFQVLEVLKLRQLFVEYQPILVGTIPIKIDIPSSDIDILICAKDLIEMESLFKKLFSTFDHFFSRYFEVQNKLSLTCSFDFMGEKIEIFAQDCPTTLQYGYLHMIIEHHVLQREGESFRQKILDLKRNGIKTEAAFCQLLSLDGDPFESLLNYGRDLGYCP